MDLHLNVAYYNCNSLAAQKCELEHFLFQRNIDVLLLNETFLKPSHRFRLANYKSFRSDRISGRGGGTAILIKTSLKCDAISLQTCNFF